MSPRILLNGAKGRMGQAIIRCAGESPETSIAAALDVGDNIGDFIADCDVVIDFSHADATQQVAAAAAAAAKPIVIGTTGHSQKDRAAIEAFAKTIALVFAPNFSIGVNTLFHLTEQAARILGEEYDIEVVEMHHRLKKDSPSGTARRLGEILAAARGLAYETDTRHGREGMVGERARREIGMHALRGGDVVGDHTVVFAANGERIELTHKASSRDTFANGALRAAVWAVEQPPGLYDMQDVLGLRKPGV